MIETIDVDSDNEGEVKKTDTESEKLLETTTIKDEPADIDVAGPYITESKNHWFDEALQHTAEEHENLDRTEGVDSFDDLAEEENEITQAIQFTLSQQNENMMPQITCVFGNVDDTNAILSQIDESGATITNPNTLYKEQTVPTDAETVNSPIIDSQIIVENTSTDINNGTVEENEPVVKKSSITVEVPEIVEAIEPIEAKEPEKTQAVVPEIIDLDDSDTEITPENKNEKEVPEEKAKIKTEVKGNDKFTFGELSNDMNFADDGIAFVDDGIPYSDDYGKC